MTSALSLYLIDDRRSPFNISISVLLENIKFANYGSTQRVVYRLPWLLLVLLVFKRPLTR